MVAYALIDDLLALFETQPKPARQPRLESLLETATSELNGEVGGADYFRHPTGGSATWLVDGSGSNLLHLHRGIVALDTLEVSLDLGLTFIVVDAADYRLQWDWQSSEAPPDGEPWFHLRMLPYAVNRCFPRGSGTVRLTGASGWPVIPAPLVEGTATRARQLAFADASYEGSVPSQDEYGPPTVSGRWPDVTWKFLQRERRRFYACEA